MSGQATVLLMTPDASLSTTVSVALRNGHLLVRDTPRDPRELLHQMGKAATPIVLVDLDPEPRKALAELEGVIARYPASRFVALSSQLDNELLLEAMQTGVRRVLTKQSLGDDLQGVLNRLTTTAVVEEGPKGDLFTLLSASGGCGATTLAINLAEELATQHNSTTLLMDMDASYGALATYLGLEPQYALDHVLSYNGPIDGNLISSTATIHGQKIHVMASPAATNFSKPEALKTDRLEQALHAARGAYRDIVVDAPRIPMDVAAILVAQSTCTFLTFQLTVKDIRIARAMLDALTQRGVSLASVRPVANRYVKRQMISLEEAGKALGDVKVACIRNDYASAIQGLNFGQTLAEASPRSTIRRDLQSLLAMVSAPKQ